MPVSILDRLAQFDRQRPPGRSIPKIVAERLARYFPKVLIGWDGERKLWCLAQKSRQGVRFLCYIERDGGYAPLTLRNTVQWLRDGQIARVARTKYELARYQQLLEARRNAERDAIVRRALNQMREGDKNLYRVAVGRKTLDLHGRLPNRSKRR